MAKETKKLSHGTSFHDVTIKATPNQLIKLFPNSYYEENTGNDKTNFDFTLETDDGDVFTIYDWKEYRKLKLTEKINWHIGAENHEICLKAKEELLKML